MVPCGCRQWSWKRWRSMSGRRGRRAKKRITEKLLTWLSGLRWLRISLRDLPRARPSSSSGMSGGRPSAIDRSRSFAEAGQADGVMMPATPMPEAHRPCAQRPECRLRRRCGSGGDDDGVRQLLGAETERAKQDIGCGHQSMCLIWNAREDIQSKLGYKNALESALIYAGKPRAKRAISAQCDRQ